MISLFNENKIIPIIIIDEFEKAAKFDYEGSATLIAVAKNLNEKAKFVVVGSHSL